MQNSYSYKFCWLSFILVLVPISILAQDETANPTPFSYTPELENIANSGDMDAQFQIGYCYYNHTYYAPLCSNNPLIGNIKKALKYLKEAASQGHVMATFLVGSAYMDGAGVEKNEKQGIKLIQWAAERCCILAYTSLGYYYEKGRGVEADLEKALYYSSLAAEKGEGVANRNLGLWYYNGIGVKKDKDKAVHYFYRAVECGYVDNKQALIDCFNSGARNAAFYSSYTEWIAAIRKEEAKDGEKTVVEGKQESIKTKFVEPRDVTIKDVQFPSSDVDLNLPQSISENCNTFAVIFANENYQEETAVEFALNDGDMFHEYCNKVLGIPEDNIHIRKDATLNNIKAELAWMQQVAKAYKGEARFIVYYAGHGIPDEKTGTAYLLPVDGKGTMLETGLSLTSFYGQLSQMDAKDVTVFMDACFSGSKRGDGMLASARGVAIKAKAQAPKGRMVVFSAAQGDETAYPFKAKGHGLFTYYLLKKLKETKGNVTYAELNSYISEEVSRKSIVANGKSQTPTVMPSASLGDRWKTMKLK